MGKYIRKAKTAGEVAVMEFAQSSLGVRTRAKTLALQRLQKSLATPATGSAPLSAGSTGGGSYLQLRSRRLEKPPILVHQESKKQRQQQQQGGNKQGSAKNPNSRTRLAQGSSSVGEKKGKVEVKEEEIAQGNNDSNESKNNSNNKDWGVETSFGDNLLDIDGRERSTRESTPCSLIRDPESIRTPGSTTRPTSSTDTNRRVQNSMQRHIPTAHEMDEFFAGAEEQQQRQFVEKYNFDPVNDKPLPGRYEWEKVDP
ncbi:hypothetical protein SLE2022_153390 [Rubroshorea leprosula]|uniref:Cyclin-dependent kinase inhibitor domain-containing protein n=1 Tax=Rubroshorea leprosula TaxID=152421 RepID=A0AAV5KVX5_9ROSI|nr:hypothetical protein SLEP1_g37730 [Rubroshorea leprosula]